jgi:uncharacterized protein (UPF0332 family)
MKQRKANARVRPQRVDAKQIRAFVENAAKKLEAARTTSSIAADAAYELAYGAMVKAALALMLSHGQRPRALPGHHELIIQFAEQHLPNASVGMFAMFDRMRRKRSEAFYDIGIVGEVELDSALATAKEFLSLVQAEINRRHPST